MQSRKFWWKVYFWAFGVMVLITAVVAFSALVFGAEIAVELLRILKATEALEAATSGR